MLTRSQISAGLRAIGLGDADLLVHSSYSSFGGVEGGPPAVVEALTEVASTVLFPAFTYETSTWDESGTVPGNAYPPISSHGASVIFTIETPVSDEIGVIPEVARQHPNARRSMHPAQSFVAIGPAAAVLVDDHEAMDPLAPIRRLYERGGQLLLLGVSHTSSTSVHLAELLEGRAPFLRHAMVPQGLSPVHTSGCSNAFDSLQPLVEALERHVTIGACEARAYALVEYVDAARAMIAASPNALLCDGCERCNARRVTPS